MTVYEILKAGGKIEFASGYILKGDPSTNYIDTGFTLDGIYCSDGLRVLTKEGTALAIKDAKKYTKHKNHVS